jgi:hypothetical protein
MGAILTFTVTAAVALAATLATLALLRPHLDRMLTELCGSRSRAAFWLIVSLLAVGLCATLAATATFGYPPSDSASSSDLFLGGLTQLRLFIVGLLGSVLIVAWGVLQGIRSFERRADMQAYYAAMKSPGGQPPAPPTPPAAAPGA